MTTSPNTKVIELYSGSAESYVQIMDAEIDLPLYGDVLGRLAERLRGTAGPLLDTSCGPGHMLARYRGRYDSDRALLAVDLSPRMVALCRERLGDGASVWAGDMRELPTVATGSVAGVISFYALHHLGTAEVLPALREWRRVLRTGGQLLLTTWEGSGPIDYGAASDIVALRHGETELRGWVQEAGFRVDRCVVETTEQEPMDAADDMPARALHLEATC